MAKKKAKFTNDQGNTQGGNQVNQSGQPNIATPITNPQPQQQQAAAASQQTNSLQQSGPSGNRPAQFSQKPQKRRDNRPDNRSGNHSGGHSRQLSLLRRLRRSTATQLVLVAIIALLPSIYFYHQSQVASSSAASPSSANLQTTAAVVKQVSRHILLPSGEQPTVATVSDASKVRGQAFFANAASGDKVLVYAGAKKAYLYRPSIDRLIEVAPLAASQTSP